MKTLILHSENHFVLPDEIVKQSIKVSCNDCQQQKHLDIEDNQDWCLCEDDSHFLVDIPYEKRAKLIGDHIGNTLAQHESFYRVVEYGGSSYSTPDATLSEVEKVCIEMLLLHYGAYEVDGYFLQGKFDHYGNVLCAPVLQERLSLEESVKKIFDLKNDREKLHSLLDDIYFDNHIVLAEESEIRIEGIATDKLLHYRCNGDHPSCIKDVLQKMTAVSIMIRKEGESSHEGYCISDDSLIYELTYRARHEVFPHLCIIEKE